MTTESNHTTGGIKGVAQKKPLAILVCLSSLLLTAVIMHNIFTYYRGPDYAGQRLQERKNYYEKVLLKADVSFHEARFYEVIR